MNIPTFNKNAPLDEISAALATAGCAVVHGLTDAQTRAASTSELAPHMETVRVTKHDDPDEFYPGLTKRVSALVTRSPTTTDELMVHPFTKRMCADHLLPNSKAGYQLHVTAALEIGPGARGQILHREEDSFKYFPLPRPNLIVASMWAMSDFRADNGATYVVPGSHLWPAEREAQDDEILQAEMPAGSVLYWMGGLLHGAGPNTAQDWRYGIILTYSAGWVRQEENQYLDIPATRRAELSPEVAELVGLNMHEALGFYDPKIESA